MQLFDIFLIYTIIGLFCGLSIEYLMYKTNLNKGVNLFERITWVLLWPIYVIVFLIGMKK